MLFVGDETFRISSELESRLFPGTLFQSIQSTDFQTTPHPCRSPDGTVGPDRYHQETLDLVV